MDKNVKHVFVSGIITCLIVLSVSLLSANKPEFIGLKLGIENAPDLLITNYDTVLYIAYFIGGIITIFVANRLGKRKIFALIGSAGTSILFLALILCPGRVVLIIKKLIK